MPNVVTFSLFLGLSISSCAVWASAWPHQQQSKAASIVRMTSSLLCYVPLKTRQFDDICFALTIVTGCPSIADRIAIGPVPFSRANDSLASQLKESPFRKNVNLILNAP